MSWLPDGLAVAYDEKLLEWQLGANHPTNPVRAKNVLAWLKTHNIPFDVEPITREVTDRELEFVHSPAYISEVDAGYSDEWEGERKDLGAAARHMFAGTVQLVEAVIDGEVRVGFSPMGAKHHAQWDRSSGFCVYNDMAWAAKTLTAKGEYVLYIDLDAHHGDGVEALTRDNPWIMTASVHDRTIFPGTGQESEPRKFVYNYPLEAEAGNAELRGAVAKILHTAADFGPTAILIAIGGDGHKADPLSTLQYTYAGYKNAGRMIGEYAHRRNCPVIMGGAGGYRPHAETPRSWATFVSALTSAVLR